MIHENCLKNKAFFSWQFEQYSRTIYKLLFLYFKTTSRPEMFLLNSTSDIFKSYYPNFKQFPPLATSKLVTNVEDDICWWQIWDVDEPTVAQSVTPKRTIKCHQQTLSGINISKLSATYFCQQHHCSLLNFF